MSSHRLATIALFVLLATAGCLGIASEEDPAEAATQNGEEDQANRSSRTAPPKLEQDGTVNGTAKDGSVTTPTSGGPAVEFTNPTVVGEDKRAFEPSISIGPEGTVYVTAAPTKRPGPGTELASFLWYSTDGGESWESMPSPADAHTRFAGFEGDIAVDDEGQLFFIDTNLADMNFHRWGPDQTWELSRPMATNQLVNDRPWVAAHGDGVVYLLANSALVLSAPEQTGGQQILTQYRLSVSEDGGQTWTPGKQLANGFCQAHASPVDDETLLVACHEWEEWTAEGEPAGATLHLTRDRGSTFEVVHNLSFEQSPVSQTPGPAIDDDGTLYTAVLDDDSKFGSGEGSYLGSEPGLVRYVVSQDGGSTWTEHDITPFQARFGHLHAASGPPGTLAIAFYATPDLEPDEESPWYPYAMVSANATAPSPGWQTVRLLDEPSANQASPPEDFLQTDVGPDGAVHVVFQRHVPHDPLTDGAGDGIPEKIHHVRQLAGPNLPR